MASLQDRVTQDPIGGALDVSLGQGLNLIGWTGSDTPASEVADILGADFLIGWDGPDQEFERFDVGLPAAFNSLQTVVEGAGLWAFRAAAGTVTLPPPGDGPPEPGLESGEFRTNARDGVEIVGDVLVGSSTWVLFAHQNGQDRTAWGQYPSIFNDMGFTTATWDFRGFGDSGPGDRADLVLDWLAVLDFAQANGATTILGVGSSMGGTSGMVAAADTPQFASQLGVAGAYGLNALVLISAPASFFGMDALGAAPDVSIPAFFIAGADDGNAATDATAVLTVKGGELIDSGLNILASSLHGNNLATSSFQDEIISSIQEFFNFVLAQ